MEHFIRPDTASAMTFAAVTWLTILVQWILHKIQNHLSQYLLGVRLFLCTFDTEVPAPNSQDDKYPSMTRNEHFCPYLLLPRSPLSCFWLSSGAMPVFSQASSIIFSTAAFASGIFIVWGIRKLCTRLQWKHEFHSLSCNMIFMISVKSSFHSASHGFVSFNISIAFLSCFFPFRGRFPCYFGTMKCHKALQLASESLTFYEHDVLEFLIIGINEVNTA